MEGPVMLAWQAVASSDDPRWWALTLSTTS